MTRKIPMTMLGNKPDMAMVDAALDLLAERLTPEIKDQVAVMSGKLIVSVVDLLNKTGVSGAAALLVFSQLASLAAQDLWNFLNEQLPVEEKPNVQ